jgi:hypothetical protein
MKASITQDECQTSRNRFMAEEIVSRPPLSLTSLHYKTAIGIILLSFFFGYLLIVPGVVGTWHDDGLYLATGKAIAEGRGYILPNLPVELPQTKYPPLLPFLFSIIWKINPRFPSNTLLFQLLCLASLSVALGIYYLFFLRFRYAGGKVALASAVIAGTTPSILFYGSIPVAEGPFTLLSVGVFWFLEEALSRDESDNRWGVLAGCMTGMAFLCRTIGVAYLLGASIFLVLFKRRVLKSYLLFCLPPIVAWFIWTEYSRPDGVNPIFSYYISYAMDWRGTTMADISVVVASNIYRVIISPGIMLFMGAYFFSILLVKEIYVVFVVLAAVGIVVAAKVAVLVLKRRIVGWLFVLYLVVIAVHPWPPDRFLVPFGPIMSVLFFTGISSLKKHVRPSIHRFSVVAVLLLVSMNLLLLLMFSARSKEFNFPCYYYSEPPKWESIEKGLSWLKENTNKDDTIACHLDPMVWLYTGRRSSRYTVHNPLYLYYGRGVKEEDPHTIYNNLKAIEADYLFEMPLPGFAKEESFMEAIKELSDHRSQFLTKVYETEDGKVRIYKVR